MVVLSTNSSSNQYRANTTYSSYNKHPILNINTRSIITNDNMKFSYSEIEEEYVYNNYDYNKVKLHDDFDNVNVNVNTNDMLRLKLNVYVSKKYGLLLDNKLPGGANTYNNTNSIIDYDANYLLQQSISSSSSIKDKDHYNSGWGQLIHNKFSFLSSIIPLSILVGAGYAASFLLDDDDIFQEWQSSSSTHSSSSSSSHSDDDDNDDDGDDEHGEIVKNTTTTTTVSSELVSTYYANDNDDMRDIRLNYIITQVDISRMAKNASRHLDVKSILSLPTIVYFDQNVAINNNDQDRQEDACQEDEIDDDKVEDDDEEEEEDLTKSYDNWSWQMVQQPFQSTQEQKHRIEEQSKSSSSNDSSQKTFIQDNSNISPPQPQAQENNTCVICLEEFKHKDILRVLPCKHLFHMHCIDHWLLGTYSHDECYTTGCPICKKHLNNNSSNDEQEGEHVDNVIGSASQSASSESVLPSWAFTNIGNILATHQQQQDDRQHNYNNENNITTTTENDNENEEEVIILPITNIVTAISSSSSSSSSSNNNNSASSNVSNNAILLDTSDISCSVWQQEE